MKRYIGLLLLLLTVSTAWAQFDPQLGQYMYMPTAYNPAAAGEGDLMKVSGLYRMQYAGMTNAPMSFYFSFASPLVIGKTKHGLGVRFLHDQFGLWSNQVVHAQYAYRHKIGNGYLSVGVDLGFLNVGFKGDSVNLESLASKMGSSSNGYFQATDPAIPTSAVSGMGFDMGLGAYYTCRSWWAGVSYSHLTQPKVSWSMPDGREKRIGLRGTFYAAGGYHYRFRQNKQWQIHPSAMLMTDFAAWDIDLNLMCEYKDRYRWGLGYRIMSSVNVLFCVDIISGLQLGYTLEIQTSNIMRESYGSHELYLAYGFDILKSKRTNKYKSVRYL